MRTRGFVTAAVAVLAGWSSVQAGKVNVVNGVMKLEDDNFDAALEKFPVLMVKFYTAACELCAALAPKYEKAARQLRKTDMPAPRLAKVDLGAETELGKRLAMQLGSEPSLRVYKNGRLYGEYTKELETDDIVEYMYTVRWPPVVSDVQRLYYRLRSLYRFVVQAVFPRMRQTRRKVALALFPLVLGLGFALLFFAGRLLLWCSGAGGQKEPGTRGGKKGN